MMEEKKLLSFLDETIREYRSAGRWGTAHVYQSARNSFSLYNKGVDLPFRELTPSLLLQYQRHLLGRSLRQNTVATYMKVLKAVYNRAVDEGAAPFIPRLFKGVRTSPVAERRRALDAGAMGRILKESRSRPSGQGKGGRETHLACMAFALMFLLRGIPFADLIHLRKSDLRGDIITYCRLKTGRPMSVRLTSEARELLCRLQAGSDPSSPYLLPVLTLPAGTGEAYREYQAALRRFNRRLKPLGEACGTCSPLSSYAARHTWATLAYHCEVHPGVISEAMGHSSITVTETYLKPFSDRRIDLANRQVIDFVKASASAG